MTAADYRAASQEEKARIHQWAKLALSDFSKRIPKGVKVAAVLHLDEGHVHFHILAVNIADRKMSANKLHVVAMPTGHDACMREKAAHACLKREHPESLVPAPEYQGFINVLSEIYTPESLSILNATLDRIEAKVTDADRIRNSGTITIPLQTRAGIDPESAKDNPKSPSNGAPPAQSSARGRTRRRTVPRDRHPIQRSHRDRSG